MNNYSCDNCLLEETLSHCEAELDVTFIKPFQYPKPFIPEETTTDIVIRDQIMGSGKSTNMIEEINNSPHDERFIIVVPFLSEAHRYAGTICDPDSEEKQLPLKDTDGEVIYNGTGCNKSGRKFVHPKTGYKSKVEHIESLAEQGKDIVTTHAALKLFSKATAEAIKRNGYRLILDEELECVSKYECDDVLIDLILEKGCLIEEPDTKRLSLNPENSIGIENIAGTKKTIQDSGLSEIKEICKLIDNGSLYLMRDLKNNPSHLMWQYPPEFIRSFKRIDVLTYNFAGTIFESYLRLHKIDYRIQSQETDKVLYKQLINIVDNERMNKVGEKKDYLSMTKQKNMRKGQTVVDDIKKNLENFFKNKTYGGNSDSEHRLWTCRKSARSILQGRGYTKRFIPWNIIATNEYAQAHKLAYIVNASMHPDIYNFFVSQSEEIIPSKDTYAINSLLQWLFRSRVRNKEPVTLYIPSSRMRELLKGWLND